MSIVTINFDRREGTIRPMHGVNNGPLTFGLSVDTSDYYRRAGIPYARLHDTEYSYGSGLFVDIHCVFPNYHADENSASSYNFTMTDAYIKAIQDTGCETFYRLGVSIEHSPLKKYTYPPTDYRKWAIICEHIIRHYNEGWANGFQYGLKYWEIWNEPEDLYETNTGMWAGTSEQYYELYAVTSIHLKKCFGESIKVGGYAACGHHAPFEPNDTVDDYNCEYTKRFLRYVKKRKAPLDFYSWHLYSHSTEIYEFRADAIWARETLDSMGFRNTESICDEWNCGHTPEIFQRMRTVEGAACYAAAMIIFQQEKVDIATYYDAQPTSNYCGIFSRLGEKTTKSFYAFEGWNELYRLKNMVHAVCYGQGHYVCAAISDDGEEAAVLLSAYHTEKGRLNIELNGFFGENGVRIKTYKVSESTEGLDCFSCEDLTGDSFKTVLKNDRNTLFLIKLKKI